MTSNNNNVNAFNQFETIEDLTAESFTKLLKEESRYYSSNREPVVQSLSTRRIDQGVLSCVYKVTIDCCDNTNNNNYNNNNNNNNNGNNSTEKNDQIPSNWIIKLKRPELNLEWMFQCEQAFYYQVIPTVNNCYGGGSGDDDNPLLKKLPFTFAKPLSASKSHLLIEYIPDCKCYNLLEGCPPNRIDFLLDAMAAWHATCWELQDISQIQHLTFPPGMGQRLDPLQKEFLFLSSWEKTIHCMELSNTKSDNESLQLYEFAVKLCQQMSKLKLRIIHDKVHSKQQQQWTCVHGDWHIANWLFPTSDGENIKKPVLVDWATCGYGNPMIDFVFFLVVSTNDKIVSNALGSLQQYYNTLLQYNPQISVSLETLQRSFQWALLCQWMILVAYDDLCRTIAMGESDEDIRKSQLQHFQNVNRRCLLALHAFENWDIILAEIPTATSEERMEAQDFCKDAVLKI